MDDVPMQCVAVMDYVDNIYVALSGVGSVHLWTLALFLYFQNQYAYLDGRGLQHS